LKILVATAMLQMHLHTVRSAFLQQWDGPLDFMFLSGGDSEDGYQAVTDKYERARRQALAGGYDYLFCVEADMIIPPDALYKLVRLGADVGYGLYCWRHGKALGMWSAYPIVEQSRGYSLSHNKDEARACWGEIAIVAGVGLGCTLIARKVLEAIHFHHALGDQERPIPVHCDWCLAEDCQRLGFTQAMDLSIVCGHILDTTPRAVVWPDVDAEDLYRIDLLAA
jgi:hypothetical protein